MRMIRMMAAALLLAASALAEMPDAAFAGVASPLSAAAVASIDADSGPLAKAAYRYCRYTYYGKACGRWHYGYRYHYRRRYVIRYCRNYLVHGYYGWYRVRRCGRWH
jgi:hypothetical protein